MALPQGGGNVKEKGDKSNLRVFVLRGRSNQRTQLDSSSFNWLPGGDFAVLNGEVHALTTWDPDGSGPQAEWLIAGGTFTQAGSVPAQRVAAWAGASWHALGCQATTGVTVIGRAITVQTAPVLSPMMMDAVKRFSVRNRCSRSAWARLGIPA